MSHVVHVPYTVEVDEDRVWCAHAQLRPRVGAHGEGDTRDAAIADLPEALIGLIAEFGAPEELAPEASDPWNASSCTHRPDAEPTPACCGANQRVTTSS